MKKLLEKLKTHWDLDDHWQLASVLLIFSISGISVLYVRKLAFGWLGFDQQTPIWEEIIAWLLLVVPSYQILFLFFGFLFGQFDFVCRFERHNFRFIKNCLVKVKQVIE